VQALAGIILPAAAIILLMLCNDRESSARGQPALAERDRRVIIGVLILPSSRSPRPPCCPA
jgi:hypothetical protein